MRMACRTLSKRNNEAKAVIVEAAEGWNSRSLYISVIKRLSLR